VITSAGVFTHTANFLEECSGTVSNKWKYCENNRRAINNVTVCNNSKINKSALPTKNPAS
jgi:hypothetical protein